MIIRQRVSAKMEVEPADPLQSAGLQANFPSNASHSLSDNS